MILKYTHHAHHSFDKKSPKEVGKQSSELRMKYHAVPIPHITIHHTAIHHITIHHIQIHHATMCYLN